jgi:hypothetical protein
VTNIDRYQPDLDRMEPGEPERVTLAAYAELKSHPERRALATLYHALSLLTVVVAATVLLNPAMFGLD